MNPDEPGLLFWLADPPIAIRAWVAEHSALIDLIDSDHSGTIEFDEASAEAAVPAPSAPPPPISSPICTASAHLQPHLHRQRPSP